MTCGLTLQELRAGGTSLSRLPRALEPPESNTSSDTHLAPLLVRISLADVLVLVVRGIAFPGKRRGVVRREKAHSPILPARVIQAHRDGQDEIGHQNSIRF